MDEGQPQVKALRLRFRGHRHRGPVAADRRRRDVQRRRRVDLVRPFHPQKYFLRRLRPLDGRHDPLQLLDGCLLRERRRLHAQREPSLRHQRRRRRGLEQLRLQQRLGAHRRLPQHRPDVLRTQPSGPRLVVAAGALREINRRRECKSTKKKGPGDDDDDNKKGASWDKELTTKHRERRKHRRAERERRKNDGRSTAPSLRACHRASKLSKGVASSRQRP
mmetsp:Transcript_15528/g.50929  ORF Transcript_15528/g.50929 Transcript_15528/m.50929 type:complete len:220 (+) Transcript_15528:962-1621(+)